MLSATRYSGGTGNEVGVALTSIILRSALIPGFRVDEVAGLLAGEHAQHLVGGAHGRARARLARAAREVRREDHVVQRKQRMTGRDAVVLVDIEHRAGD